jgi:mono/diheme cytochrome c family protein
MNVVRLAAAGTLIFAALSMVGSTRASSPSEAAGDPVKGKQVYLNSVPKCSLCHSVGASGGKFGPDLTAVGKKRDAAWLAKYLPNPQFENPANKMPAVTAKGKDLEDLIAYLVSLKGK